jgi:hypothetical protein
MQRVGYDTRGVRHGACRYYRLVLLVAFVLGMQTMPARGTIIAIDHFNSPNPAQFFILGTGSNPSTAMSYDSPDIIGGQRDTLVNVVGQGTPTSVVGIVGHDQSYGIDALQVGTNGLSPTVVTLLYSGLGTQGTASALVNAHALALGLGIDLSGGGTNDRFKLHFFSSDARPTVGLDVAVTITSPNGKLSTATVDAPNSTTGFDLNIPFSKLVGNADVTHVDSIKFVFNGVRKTANVDYEVQLLAVVPEPGGAMLIATGMAVVGGVAARRRSWSWRRPLVNPSS